MRAFISVDGFQISRMADHLIFTANPVATMHVPRLSCYIQCLADIVAFDDRNHIRRKFALVHQTPDAQTCLKPQRNIGHHIGKLFLEQLGLGQWSAKLNAVHPVLTCGVPTGLGGPHGRLLDAEIEDLGAASVSAFEIEGLVGTTASPPVLSYLFHRIGDRLNGRPTLLIIDEGWLALDETSFGGQLREWLKTLRKKNASVVFATQSLADIDASPIAPSIVESCPTRIFLPNERAFEPQIADTYRRFGLNDRQIEIVARAFPKRDYYCQSRRGNRLFSLGLGDVALAFTAASSKIDQTAISDLLVEHGREGFAKSWLHHRGLDWAVELLDPSAAASPDSEPNPTPKETDDDLQS